MIFTSLNQFVNDKRIFVNNNTNICVRSFWVTMISVMLFKKCYPSHFLFQLITSIDN